MIRCFKSTSFICLFCALCYTLGDTAALGCPNCRDALAGDPDQANMVQGLFWSILFLLSMPFLLLASLSAYFYWIVRVARAATPALVTDGTVHESPFVVGESIAEEQLETVGA